jgi:hypothetical protein
MPRGRNGEKHPANVIDAAACGPNTSVCSMNQYFRNALSPVSTSYSPQLSFAGGRLARTTNACSTAF